MDAKSTGEGFSTKADAAGAGDGANLLVISDLHLGSDLVGVSQGEGVAALRSLARLDRDLAAFLEHYGSRRDGDRPWRLVIAGDLIDFIGMAIFPEPGEVATELAAEERRHGLGGAEDHALAKLRRVTARHRLVFRKLAAFVAAGHRLVLVPGNHDADLHWSAVQAELRRLLAAERPDGAEPVEAFDARIELSPWFHWVEGVAFIEHGHQYDAFCSFDHVMKPVSPRDPRRTIKALSDVLIRYIVRPTAGLGEDGHDAMGVLDYVRFAWSLGARGGVALLWRFVRAIVALFALWREHVSGAARAIREEHEKGMEQLAALRRAGVERLRALAALQVPPITRSAFGVMRSVMLDRILGTGSHALAVAGTALLLGGLARLLVPLALVIGWAFGLWVMRRYRVLDPAEELRRRAAQVLRLFPAAFVVMGHTHLPRRERLEGGGTYVNVGTWASEGGREAPCTHLVIRHLGGELHAELMRWDGSGPVAYS